MRRSAIALGLVCVAGAVHAGPFRATPEQGARLYRMKVKSGGAPYVDRSALPGHGPHAAQRIGALRQAMEDEITGVHGFAGRADTPAFELVSTHAQLHQIAEAGYGSDNVTANGGVAAYRVRATDLLPGHRLGAVLLLPVSGHTGPGSAETYARTNRYQVQVNGGPWITVPSEGRYVTEKRLDLTLRPGRNEIRMEPYQGGWGGYTQGRTVHVDVD
jgi:hypothetical protein